ncbi:MAG TPA: SDR family oxidoreductase [Planctomycetota bacterium]|nr:SDR family oxidoreductase [Planctomycetota bacterium]
MADFKLAGKRAIVTGGSRGIGKAIARALAQEGVDVVISSRNQTQVDATAAELSKQTGRKVIGVVADTTNDKAVDSLVAETVRRLGGVDILVNNAAAPGGLSTATKIEQVDSALALEDINIKVIGYLRTARAVAPHFIKQKWGRIINIGGLAIRKTGRPVATLRNVGVAAVTKNLADELGPHGINVTAVHPGATRTERTDDKAEKIAAGNNSIGRIVDSSEVAAVVTFLASPLSVAITGDAIAAGGGSPGTIHY